MSQAAIFSFNDVASLQSLNVGKLLWLAVAGLVVWAFKKDWVAIVTFGPYDRGFREFFGRPGYLLRQGPHLHIIGLGNLRKASVASSIVSLKNRVVMNDKVYEYVVELVIRIEDDKQRIYAAIYETFDENKKDSYNAQRLAYVRNTVEWAIREILKPVASVEHLTLEAVHATCQDDLLDMTGTLVEKLMITEFTPVDAQILRDGMLETNWSGDGVRMIPVPSPQSA